MAETFLEKLSAWNGRMNGIPRKALLVAITLCAAWLILVLFPYCWPFIVALVFSMVLEPFVRLLTQGLQRLKAPRNLATLLGMLILFGLVAVLLFTAINRLWRELMSLVRAIPELVAWLSDTAIPWAQGLYSQYRNVLPPYALDLLDNAVKSVGQMLLGFATSLSRTLTSGAWATAMSLVDVILSVVLTIMGTFYLTADKSRILAFLRRTFPHEVVRHSSLIKTNLVHALFGQIKSQLSVSLIVISFLVLVFVLFGVPYGLLAALIIGVADALPVVGAGLFLIPWSIFGFVVGDVRIGVIMAASYIGTIVIRQIFEPRIVGKNLGLYPLATMIAMYAGYRAFGFLGMLGGPVMLNVLKVVLAADNTASPPPASPVSSSPPASPVSTSPVSSSSVSFSPPPAKTPPPQKAPPSKKTPPADGELTLPGGQKKPFRVKGK